MADFASGYPTGTGFKFLNKLARLKNKYSHLTDRQARIRAAARGGAK